jgi:hypothetical protein
MKFIYFLLVIVFSSATAQQLHHQILSSQGASKNLSNGMYVSQSIGQQSVIGSQTVEGYTYGQGFQQSTWSKYITASSNNSITTITYPNPFISSVNFQFSQEIKGTVTVSIFDIRGRLVYNEEKKSVGTILTIELPNIASSNYLVKLSASNYNYFTQILKQ